MKILKNYLLLTLILVYIVLLGSKVCLEKLPREVIKFCLIYFVLYSVPLVARFVVNQLKRKNQESKPKEVKTFLKKLQEKIKNSVTRKVLQANKYFYEEFILSFLAKNKMINILFYSAVNMFDKIIGNFNMVIVLIRIPWLIFLMAFLYEMLTGNFFLFSLYLLSFNVLLKVLINGFILLIEMFTLRQANRELIIYFLDFLRDPNRKKFFLSKPLFRESLLLDSSNSELANKKVLPAIWDILVKIFHFTLLRLQVDQLHYLILKEKRFHRSINFLVFGSALFLSLTAIFDNFQDLLSALIILSTIFIFSLLSLNYFFDTSEKDSGKLTEADLKFKNNALVIISHETWFKLTKNELLTKYSFLEERDLIYPYSKCSATSIYQKEKEFQDHSPLRDFQNLSYYKFTLEEKSALDDNIAFYIHWFDKEFAEGRIDLETSTYTPKK